MSGRSAPIRIAGIREIADRFRTWFVDAYGVLHDGSAAFPGVIETLARVRRAGSTIVLMFELPSIQMSEHVRQGPSQFLSEVVATSDRFSESCSTGLWRYTRRGSSCSTDPSTVFAKSSELYS